MRTPVLKTARRAASRARSLIVSALFVLFDRMLPVRDDFWTFGTSSHHAHTLDNPRALFEEVKNDSTICKIVLQQIDSPRAVAEGENIRFVAAESVKGAYYLARSRVVVIGVALGAVTSYSRRVRASRHTIVQLWHGIPLKRIGHLFSGDEWWWHDETPKYAATVCSSARDRENMAGAFAPLSPERVWQTGLPRNDLILKPERELPVDYREHLAALDRLLDGKRLVLYAPTWRKQTESLYVFSEQERQLLTEVLTKHGAVLGIRGHSNVRHDEAYQGRSAGCILYLNDIPDVNLILRRTEVLVTDYSSIFIDFLLLDRPILHFAYDLEDYLAERGFLYDLEDAFGGLCVRDFEELRTSLDTALGDTDFGGSQRRQALDLFHDHGENAAAGVRERIEHLISSRT